MDRTDAPSAGTSVPMRRVAGAAFAGTTIEFYDFFIYGTAAALVFGPLFFPALGGRGGTVASFATFGVAFLFRPLGAILFGHFGDRLGRKKTLIATLLLMGCRTFAIGLVPTAAAIGVGGADHPGVLRACQGLAVGGEWAGAALLTAEYAPRTKRGLYSMFPQLGPALGVRALQRDVPDHGAHHEPGGLPAWGWRIPFLVSIVLVGVGLYIRLKIAETPCSRGRCSATSQVAARSPRRCATSGSEILLGGGTLSMRSAFFYMAIVYLGGIAGLPADAGASG